MDPMTWVMIAATILGTMKKKQSYDASMAKQRSLTQDQLARDKANRQRALNKQKTARDAFGKQKTLGDMQGETAKLAAILKQNTGNVSTTAAPYMPRNAPAVIGDMETAALNQAVSEGSAEADALAKMESFGQAMQLADPKMRQARNATRTAGNFMRGDQGPYQLALKSARSQAYSPWGDILQQLGMVGVGASLRKDEDEIVHS